jgi:hypothetical protein
VDLVEFLDMADVFRFDPREAIKRLRSYSSAPDERGGLPRRCAGSRVVHH